MSLARIYAEDSGARDDVSKVWGSLESPTTLATSSCNCNAFELKFGGVTVLSQGV